MKLTERFTRFAPDKVRWTVTVDDPKTWTRPWTFSLPLTADPNPLPLYECHEGNYGLKNILSAARAEERRNITPHSEPKTCHRHHHAGRLLSCPNRWADIPDDVRHEARALAAQLHGLRHRRQPASGGGYRHSGAEPFSGERTASVLGRAERLDPLHASLMNGISSHVEDYDDTTPKNYSHTTSPVASALFAYASANPVRGRDFVEAFILGFESASRVGNAVYPSHYDVGWHMTGTIGVFGAAAAIGKLMG